MFSNPERLAAAFLGAIAAVAVAIAVFGWAIGRIFPRVRFLAPFAVAAVPCCLALVLGTDRHFLYGVFATWGLAAAAVASYWLLRRR